MEQHTSELTTLLSKRLQALESLAREVTAGQEACIALDFEKMQAHDQQKEHLCAEICRMNLEISRLHQRCFPGISLQNLTEMVREKREYGLDADAIRLVQRLWKKSEVACAEAERRNRVYAEFLRRARSTLNVMMNVMSHCLGVYPFDSFMASASSTLERGH